MVEGHLKDMISLNLPSTIGFDVSGVVVEKGVDVNNFEIGDEVYSRVPQEQMGTVAEFVSINSELVAKKQKIVLRRSSRITINGQQYKPWRVLALKRTIDSYSCRLWRCR
jgi:NADPH:quinone reductase-like Zn-dependent oxidoreductase